MISFLIIQVSHAQTRLGVFGPLSEKHSNLNNRELIYEETCKHLYPHMPSKTIESDQ